MDLNQALAQLSIDVRSQLIADANNSAGTIMSANDNQNNTAHQQCLTNSRVGHQSNLSWQYPRATRIRQLSDFDTSIETLFAQITELEHIDSSLAQIGRTSRQKIHDQHHLMSAPVTDNSRILSSSGLGSSQEDDSDCSSQQSGLATGLKMAVKLISRPKSSNIPVAMEI